jgi:ABC-type transport system substrate-binding protein
MTALARRGRWLHSVPVLLNALLLAGCGNDPHPKALRKTEADGSPWMVQYRALGDDPRSLDPQFSYDTVGHSVNALIYESMFQYQPFKTAPYELIPCLAAEMPVHTKLANGREIYLIKIKPGIFFHDDPCFVQTGGKGRELVAEDMAYTFKRIADPKVECPILSTLQEYVWGLKEAYLEAKENGFLDYTKPLPAVEVIDRYTFRLVLSKAYPQILYWLQMPFTAPVPREAVDYYDGIAHDGVVRPQFKFHPVGTGPFRFVEWSRNHLIRLERWERYNATTFPMDGWPADHDARFRLLAGAKVPFVDEVQYAIVRESIPAWLLFRQGYLDASGIGKDVFNTVLDVARELTPEYRKRGVELIKDPSPDIYYFMFNMTDPIFGKNKKLRQAISTAYDQDFANEVFRNGIDINAQQLLPPGIFGHQPGLRNPFKKHDLARAHQLMVEAGYPNGRDARTGEQLEMRLDVVADDAVSRQAAEFEKSQIEQLGIKVVIRENTWERQQDAMINGDFQFAGFGWVADYPDPENFFFLFYSRNIPPKGGNYTRYSDPEFDRMFEQMSTMDNTPQREELAHKLTAILNEDCPVVLTAHSVSFALTQPWAPRVTRNPLYYAGSKYLKVDTALRGRRQHEWNRPDYQPLYLAGGLVLAGALYGIWWGRRHHV